jgi:methyltransferase (TIGR00027 family)
MHPEFTKLARASIVARARFVEDLVLKEKDHDVHQYVILGAGLDTFALRRRHLCSALTVYEIDEPDTQAWKERRLAELGIERPGCLRFVPVDFEKTSNWLQSLGDAGFDSKRPAVVASTGVSMYLTREAILGILRQVAALAPHSIIAMSFLLPIEQSDPEVRPLQELAMKGAAAAGTPFISFFTSEQMLELSAEAGLKKGQIITGRDLAARYFAGRKDGLYTPNGEQILVATT